MVDFNAVVRDATGAEIIVDVDADTRQQAIDKLNKTYPESRVVELERCSDE